MPSDKVDAVEVFGNSIEPRVATVGDIRRKLEGYTKLPAYTRNPTGQASVSTRSRGERLPVEGALRQCECGSR